MSNDRGAEESTAVNGEMADGEHPDAYVPSGETTGFSITAMLR